MDTNTVLFYFQNKVTQDNYCRKYIKLNILPLMTPFIRENTCSKKYLKFLFSHFADRLFILFTSSTFLV